MAFAISWGSRSHRRRSGGETADDVFRRRRLAMVADQIQARGVAAPDVLEAMRQVPRHLFVPDDLREQAYRDGPLLIGKGQTISQPYIVGLMTELAGPRHDARMLEIGTGSGYQTAVLAHCTREVHTIEILPSLAKRAARILQELGLSRVRTRIGDGSGGWPGAAPFDGIVVTAAPPEVPQDLLEQLAPGGRLVVPIGRQSQDLVVVTRDGEEFSRRFVAPVRFVPMTGAVSKR